MKNGESDVHVTAVRYHETTTGYAECDQADVNKLYPSGAPVMFSEGVTRDWSHELMRVIFRNEPVVNPEVKQQIKL
jgi:hypothetical protein